MRMQTEFRRIEPNYLTRPVQINFGKAILRGALHLPLNAGGIVLFAQPFPYRHTALAVEEITQSLTRKSIAVFQIGLLGESEANESDSLRLHDPFFLTARIVAASRWLGDQRFLQHLGLGCFGFDTAATAALMTVASFSAGFDAVVAADAQPERLGSSLQNIVTPTLLIAGGAEEGPRRMNEVAYARLRCERKLGIVPDAKILAGGKAPSIVARLATAWFQQHLHPRQTLAAIHT